MDGVMVCIVNVYEYMNIAHLPPQLIKPACRHLVKLRKDKIRQGILNNEEGWIEHEQYNDRQWLVKVKPENFSTYGAEDKTNNLSESYNNALNDFMGAHPVWPKFKRNLKLYTNI